MEEKTDYVPISLNHFTISKTFVGKCEFSSYCKMKTMKYWVILFRIILLFPIGTALAQNEPIEEDVELDSPEPETIIYNVGVELINVGAIDRGTGSSNLIFWWTIVSDDIDFTKNPPPDDWDLTNGYLIDKTGENIDPHFYKVKMGKRGKSTLVH
ncbi:MAG: hypothetical protein ACE10C_03655 [Candidatus Binatia bacterium]